MHPEHAPSPHRPDERPGAGQPGHEPSRPEPDAPAPTSAEERETLHTLAELKSPPIDRSMLDALGIPADGDSPAAIARASASGAEPADAEASVGRDDVTNSDASAPSNGPPRADAAGDALAPPAKAPVKPKKKRRKRRKAIDGSIWIPQPPIPLDPVALGFWQRHHFGRAYYNLLTDRWMLARYCSYLSLWLSTRHVLSSKGLVYVRHQKAKGNGPPPVESIVPLPHADYLMRLEYVLIQHERALNIDRHDVFTTEGRQSVQGRPGHTPPS